MGYGMELVMSLRPEWVQEILSGRKTLEVRKSGPGSYEIERAQPVRVWMYETKAGGGRGAVVGQFTCPKLFRVGRRRLAGMEEGGEWARRSGLSKEELLGYLGQNAALCFFEVEGAEACEPYPLRRLGLYCPPMSWGRVKNAGSGGL